VVAQGAYLTGRNHARRPLMFHTIALKLNAYPELLLRLQLEEEFSPYRHLVSDALVEPQLMLTMMQLQCSNIELFTGAARLPHVRACVRNSLIFAKDKPNADMLVLVDTHSDYVNGQLVHSIDKHGECWTQDASEVGTG
jgi:hypothetical protein